MNKQMKPEVSHFAGMALIWGAVAFVVGTTTVTIGGANLWGVSVLLTHVLSMPLLVVGLLGVREKYGERIGGLGKNILLLGSILGPLMALIGLIGLASPPGLLGVLFIAAPAVLFLCVSLFGVVALYKKPFPRWNAAPVIAGAWYPVLTFYYIVSSLSTGNWGGGPGIPITLEVVLISLFVIQGLGLAAMGYVLLSDMPEEVAALA